SLSTAPSVISTLSLHDALPICYSVSHDLRAPLRAINGYAQALLEDHAAGLDAEGLRLLAVVRDNALRLGEMIDALLTFSRLGRRSEEHTSELQSLAYLVCRLLL